MSILSLLKPIIGKPDATEDVKIVNALTAIESWANGNIDGTNISAAFVAALEAINGIAKLSIPAEQSRENAAYGTLATPDEIEIVVPTDGLIAVGYQAAWEGSLGSNGEAAIFLGADQLVVAHDGITAVQGARTSNLGANELASLCTCELGLAALEAEKYTGDVTTGQVLGVTGKSGETVACTIAENLFLLGDEGTSAGGVCYIFAAAGTYKLSVQFKTLGGGKVTVKNRKLWAWVP